MLNGRPFIEEMLASVPADGSIEHLVLDAGSSDGTLDVLRQRVGVRLITRPGLPLYAAWNEALVAAEANHVLFLNADDVLAKGAIEQILPILTSAPDLVCAEAEAFQDCEGGPRRIVHRYRGTVLTGLEPDELVFGAPIINAKIFRRSLLLKHGGFDSSYAFAADRALLLRLALAGNTTSRNLPTLVYRYRIHPGSMTLQQNAKRRIVIAREHRRIAAHWVADRTVTGGVQALMSAWLVHEAVVLAARGIEAADWDAVGEGAGALLHGGFSGLKALASARRIRRAYAAKVRAAIGPN